MIQGYVHLKHSVVLRCPPSSSIESAVYSCVCTAKRETPLQPCTGDQIGFFSPFFFLQSSSKEAKMDGCVSSVYETCLDQAMLLRKKKQVLLSKEEEEENATQRHTNNIRVLCFYNTQYRRTNVKRGDDHSNSIWQIPLSGM